MQKKDRSKVYYAAIALLFLLAVKLVMFLDGKVLVWLYDGASQHLSALTYYSDYLKEIFSGILHGDFSFPRWDLAIGEGSDILTTFHYYCIGDPFAFLCVLFPRDLMYLCYELMVFMRIFLSGFSFIFFINRYDGGRLREKVNDVPVALGALLYSFSCWTVMIMGRHIFFLNPMVFLPLILGGVELLISRKRSGILMAAVCISSLSNLYFLYMMAALTVIYVAVRLVILYKTKIKEMLSTLALIAVEAVTGVLLSGIVFLPVAKVFISDSRVSNDSNVGLFYPAEYYKTLPESVIAGDWDYYRLIGIGAIGIMIIYLLFVRSRSLILKVFTAICGVFLIFPVFGTVLNGFAYASNRWCFVIPLIVGAGLIAVWDDLMELRKTDAVILAAIVAVSAVLMVIRSNTEGMILTFAGIIIIVILCLVKGMKDKVMLFSFVLVLSLLARNTTYIFSFNEQLSSPAWLDLYYFGSEASYIASGDPSRPLRYSGNELTENVSPIAGISSTQFYWSNANPYVGEFRTDIASPEYRLYYYTGYNASYILLNLSGCKYYALAGKTTEPYPYGYEKIDSMDIGYDILRSTADTGFVYSYDKAVSKGVWDKLGPADRQKLISEYMVLSDEQSQGENFALGTTDVPSTVSRGADGNVVIDFEGRADSETYITFSNVQTDLIDEFFFIFVNIPETDETYVLNYYTISNWYNGRDEFTLNLGWHEEPIHKAVLSVQGGLPYTSDYSVSCIDMKDAAENVSERFACVPDRIDIEDRGTDISFTVNGDRDRYYVLAVPYAEGWQAYIDGEKTDVIRANIQYMAVHCGPGEHTVRFTYKGDINKGAYMSLAGIIVAAGYLICGKIKKDN